MATVPTSGTNIRLLADVPFSNDYKNTRWFDTVLERTNYFLAKPVIHTMSEANFQRIEGKTFIAVNMSIDELWTTNYLMFQNSHYNSKWFYGFVTKLEYVQKKTTYVHFQIDVLQTWRFDYVFKPSFVVREHRPLWNLDGSPVTNTIDEGLDYGQHYDTVSIEKYSPFNDNFFLVIVSKETMHGGSEDKGVIKPVLNGSPQPLSYYVHPFKLSGASPRTKWSGEFFVVSPVLEVLRALYTNTNAVNNIVSIYVTEHIGKDLSYDAVGDIMDFSIGFDPVTIQDATSTIEPPPDFNTYYAKNLGFYGKSFNSMMNKYNGYSTQKESKLLMYPYTVLVLDDFKGNRVEYKNEYIDTQNLSISARGSLGTSNKVVYGIEQYLAPGLSGSDLQTYSLENSLISNNPNDVPIITDMLSAYLQGNRNSIANKQESVIFNGGMGMINSAIGGASSGSPMGVINGASNMLSGAGNTVLQIQGIEAKIKDINNMPPQMSKMGSNTHFDFGHRYSGVYILKKQIKEEYVRKLGDFFDMFGYKTNEVKIPNFHTRQYWNYVQTSSCFIIGNLNNEDLQELKSIFDNGITLWHTDDVGNYALINEVL